MPPQPRPHLTPQQQEAVRLQATGVTQKEVARRVGVSIRTVESWQTKKLYKECLQSLSGQIGLASAPSSDPKPVAVEVLEPRDVLEMTKDFEHLSDFEVGRTVLRAIALNPESREASRIQAAMALIRSVEIGQDLPKHIRQGQEKTTLEEEREKLKGLTKEEIAAEYEYLMSAEYRIAELEKKSREDAIATIRIEKRKAERIATMNAEELAQEYKRLLDET
jgi:transcriptional regulator with XRE-family HTH domain